WMVQSRARKMEARFDSIEARMEEMFKVMQELRNERGSPRDRGSQGSGMPIRGSAEQWRKLELPLFRGDEASIWI
ncbi:hypothetical protein PIB30_098487, partial [Stylosanthes scabra]|nr:hypothetical protein [Stylosanthes scabra]